jgi:ActR/RegA family two-component response regulator
MREVPIVDDETSHLDAVRRRFQGAGWAVRVCSGYDQALRCIGDHREELLIIEPNLAGTTWYGMLRSLTEVAPKPQFVVLTAFLSQALLEECRLRGALGCVRKPMPDSLVSVLDRQDAQGGAAAELAFDPPNGPLLSLAGMEWEYLNKALRQHSGCVSQTARALNIPRQTLYRKLRCYPPTW